jgi:hypothetical protein
MLKSVTLSAVLVLAAAAPAAAGWWAWGVGVGFGPPIYREPPPAYVPAPPPGFYEGAPVVVVPGEPPAVYGRVDPGEVLDALVAAGYRELGPMRERGGLFRLTAVDPVGNRVALEISVYTGEIERQRLLEARYEEPSVVAPAPPPWQAMPQASVPPAAPGGAPSTLRDRLNAQTSEPDRQPAGEPDPLVVY